MASKTAPTHLKHKPIYAINDYDRIDGEYKNNSDVHALTLGKAQWADEFIPSVKVWRKTEKRWSRQSEETTITRALDMAMLAINVLNSHYHGVPLGSETTVFGDVTIEKINGASTEAFSKFIDEHRDDIEAHIKLLEAAIDKYNENRVNESSPSYA